RRDTRLPVRGSGRGDRQQYSCEKLPIPGNGLVQAFIEGEQRTPAEFGAGAAGAQILMTYFVGRFVAYLGLERRIQFFQDDVDELEHGHLDLVREVEGLAAQGVRYRGVIAQ